LSFRYIKPHRAQCLNQIAAPGMIAPAMKTLDRIHRFRIALRSLNSRDHLRRLHEYELIRASGRAAFVPFHVDMPMRRGEHQYRAAFGHPKTSPSQPEIQRDIFDSNSPGDMPESSSKLKMKLKTFPCFPRPLMPMRF
jgi:hypothetical protein